MGYGRSTGIPLGGLRNLTRRKHQFHDTELSGSVKFACHALAIDEQRSPFKPILWEYKPKEGQSVKQVWFPGVHSNVGGGYPDRALADISLDWMISRAKAAGLAIDENVTMSHHLKPDPMGKIYQSKKGFYKITKGFKRVIGISEERTRDEGTTIQGEDPTQSVHQSAIDRWDEDPESRPASLVNYFSRTRNKVTA